MEMVKSNAFTGGAVAGLTSTENIIMAAGKGIDFSANANATGMVSEVLSDYESGTWTAAYASSVGSFTTMTMNNLDCRYTKVGQMVTVSGLLRTAVVDNTGASGTVSITGLPFPVSYWGAGVIGSSTGFAGDMPSSAFGGGSGTAIFLLYRTTANAASIDLNVTDIQNGTVPLANYMFIEFTYQTTS